MKKQILIFGIALLGAMTSCKKDEQSPEPKTAKEILTEGEWLVEYIESRVYLEDSLLDIDTETIGAFARFYPDNYVIARIPGEPADTSSYILKDNSLWIDDIKNDITTLTEEEFIFTFSEVDQTPQGEVKILNTTYLSK